MHFNSTCQLQSIANESFIILKKQKEANMTQIISLNDSAAWLWKKLEGIEFDKVTIVNELITNFDISKEIAEKDATIWIDQLRDNHLLED